MKLWWPHCEALIAFLMAYSQTKKPELLDRFFQIYEYTFSHVSKPSCTQITQLFQHMYIIKILFTCLASSHLKTEK